ncbi:hypothetical protein SMD44_00894 [Streptomyces alboflavus]|uniref:Uncharacterized protein n=1 Tax=Streptomyces alboflavus TaxID=67267 RepID=A0A1Z1W500_9ACTN|nr:hypothetical protein [Streptomyces alboflavus]ARX81496.1 hypothetical protein SMD44_00894 [Streptomyces alboflavus]
MRIPIWPGVRLSVWEPQNPEAVHVRLANYWKPFPVRRVLSKRGWMILWIRYDWRDKGKCERPTLDTAENGAWHSVWLHGNWRYLTRNMTTPEREHAARCVEAYDRHLAEVDGEPFRSGPQGLRWWRSEAML